MRIIPGYDKYDYDRGVDRWHANGRVRVARLHFSDGREADFTLYDSNNGLQDMKLAAPKKTTFVEMEIVSVYPADTGTNHDAQDTSVSEMRVEGWAE
ncbi:MAG: hypothetical protein FDZ70_10265 [Actinobacteria bacterium]|nr:MAG: hypothetical protein FDZ70_10265 [Actinomycetota bacterium]